MMGLRMVADIGTKSLSSERFNMLRKELHMTEVPRFEEKKNQKDPIGPTKTKNDIQAAASVVRLLTLAAALSVAKGNEDEDEGENSTTEFEMMMIFFAVAIVLATVFCQLLWKVGVEKLSRGLRSQPDSLCRSLPAGEVEEKEEVEEMVRHPTDVPNPTGECQVPEEEQWPERLPTGVKEPGVSSCTGVTSANSG